MSATTISYWKSIATAFQTLSSGLKITFRHLINARHSRKPLSITDPDYFAQPDGISTIQYPHELLPVPDAGRYRLHNEIDDCIVCDKCAKICPVNCITIEPIKAVEEIGRTSDGTPKRIYAAQFDINMAQCCFCGLCTTVCPTECLTMTRVYDFSVTNINEHNFAFAEMTATEITERKKALEEYQRSKVSPLPKPVVPMATDIKEPDAGQIKPTAPKPVFKPKMKPPGPPPTST
jgi:formate hydrogenlyase subunit 6/NADH:ubiquinone oxidoreductase subunit I